MSPTRLLLAVALTVLSAGVAHAQQPPEFHAFDFQWTSITHVGLWPRDPRTAAPPSAPERILRGHGTLTLAANRMPGAAFGFDLRAPDGTGRGSGLVLLDHVYVLESQP